jgi:IclR family acetate operon transcriptional repressor
MQKRENFPNRRKYNTKQGKCTTVSTSLRRATGILTCLSNDINTITDIAGYWNFSTSTVHRLLSDLKELDWIIQDNNSHKYYLGPLVTQLATNRIGAHKYLIMHALREMAHLLDVTEESINLAIMIQLRHMFLHEIPSRHDLKISGESRLISPIYAGATAKVLLSQLDDEQLETTLKHIKFDRADENGITDKAGLMAQLIEIRRQGCCVTHGEKLPGAVCISAPINNYICPASLNILGPENRLGPKVKVVIEELKASARRISGDIAEAFDQKEVAQEQHHSHSTRVILK